MYVSVLIMNRHTKRTVSVLLSQVHTHKVYCGVLFGIVIGVFISVIVLNYVEFSSHSNLLGFILREVKSDGNIQVSGNAQGLLSDHQQVKSNFTSCSKELSAFNNCEVIHIAIVCAGYNSSRTFVPLIKSILYNRKNPLFFHIVVDDQSNVVLRTLFSTWHIPRMDVKFYHTDLFASDVNWVPTTHYSGIFGLIKLSLISNLPWSIGKVIILDTDVIFNTDIGQLLTHATAMTTQQILGLVENQSDWYFGKLLDSGIVWPALGRGFNTGVVIVNLNNLSNFDWSKKWRNVTRNVLRTIEQANLADQDVINAVIEEYPFIVYELPCCWNIQLSLQSLSSSCYHNAKDIKTLHWNSPAKLNVKNRHAVYFKSLHNKYSEFDGNVLRRDIGCDTIKPSEAEAPTTGTGSFPFEDPKCYEFRRASLTKYRTHLFFLSNKGPAFFTNDITLVVFLTMNRLHMIEQLLNAWKDPISFTVYLSDPEAMQLVSYYEASPHISLRSNVVFHVVYKEETYIPVNYLRNVGIMNVKTSYIFLSDIDFLPVKNFSNLFMKTHCHNCKEKKTAFVVPAFDVGSDYNGALPKSKPEVLDRLKNREIRYFNITSHYAPDHLRKWKSAKSPYKVDLFEIYSPLVIVDKNVPLYDTRFVAVGWNEESHSVELDQMGYDFVILPNSFAFHMSNLPRIDNGKFHTSNDCRECLSVLQEEFMVDLKEKHRKVNMLRNNTLIADNV